MIRLFKGCDPRFNTVSHLGHNLFTLTMESRPTCSYEGFCQFRSRTNERETIIDLFRNYGHQTGFKSAKSLISIGAGDGELDSELIQQALPELMSYTAVECEEDMYRHLCDNIHTGKCGQFIAKTELKVSLLNRHVEEYVGPDTPESCDVVFMMHLLYYFGDKWSDLIQKAMSWLKPGGRLVIGVVNEGNILQKLANLGKDKVPSWVDRIASHLQDLGLSYTEFSVLHEFHPAGCDRKFADFILQKTVTDEEVNEIFNYLSTQHEPGSTCIQHGTHIFIIQKL